MANLPAIPLNLKAAPEDVSINLAWSPSTPALTLATTYHVKRALVSGGPYTEIATTSSTSYQNTGLINGTSYYYVVSASNVDGSSGNSNEAFAIPQPVGLTDWQHENEGTLVAGPTDDSMAICTEGLAPIRILINRVPRYDFRETGTFRSRALFSPNTILDGDSWNDVVQGTFIDYPNHVKQSRVGCIFTQLATVTVGNATGEASLMGTGVGTPVLPSAFLVAGKNIRVRAKGFYSADGAATLRLKLKIGTVILDTGAVVLTSATDKVWDIDCDITCRETGPMGSVIGQGFISIPGVQLLNLAPVTINTVVTAAFDITAEWDTAAAGDTITATNVSIEILN